MNKKVSFVKVPKTAASSVLYQFSSIWHSGFKDLNYMGKCYIDHNLPFHLGGGTYCKWNNLDRHICSSAYRNLGNENYYYYTQLRDPYDMACSLYFFLKRENNVSIMGTNVDADYHNYSLISSGVSINEFLENMAHNQTYSHYYDDLDITEFDAVGWVNDMTKTQGLLSKIFNIDIDVATLNVNPNKKMIDAYSFEFNRDIFRKINYQEYYVYNRGIEKFQQLCHKYL